MMKTYKRYRYPSQIISHAVWLYHRFRLNFRDTEDIPAARDAIAPYKTIRLWCEDNATNKENNLKRNKTSSVTTGI